MNLEKKVLVTGANGFLGKNIALHFKKNGYVVFAIGHGKWEFNEQVKWGIDYWFESTVTLDALVNINTKFDLIVHCAGSGSVSYSFSNPFEDFQKSVLSTIALLEFIRLVNPSCKFIYPSSPAVQGNVGSLLIKEEMSSNPISPYGTHKKIAEELCRSYSKNFNVKVGIIRFFSIYGEGLKKQLIWDACNKILNNDEPIFFGTGHETRDWIYISDAVSLVYKFSLRDFEFEIINGGSGVSITIDNVIKLIFKEFSLTPSHKFNGLIREGDPTFFQADVTEAKKIGWNPEIEIEEGIKRYVEYFKKSFND